MLKISNRITMYGVYVIGYWMSFLLSRNGYHYVAGFILMVVALMLYINAFANTQNLVDLQGLFSLSWIGGQGIACLQLSKLQTDWNLITWICFFLAYSCFLLGYLGKWKKNNAESSVYINMKEQEVQQNDTVAKRVFVCMLVLTVVSVICFLIEAFVVGYIPLFSKLPHAYSYFHISGVHYFTISCILVPALTVIYNRVSINKDKMKIAIILICNMVAFAIPILCVSRFQLMFAIMFAVVIYLLIYKKITVKTVLVLLAIMIPAYVLLTIARNHDIAYLNGIFEMKYAKTPIFITQPYMYVANNYENFNCLVEQLPRFTYGVRMLFPFFALTGLKFIFPSVAQFPNYVTKTELTTFTMFYDGYYDAGIVGVILLAFIIGIVAKILTKKVANTKNPITFLFYGQFAIYLALSFFTTWFSNPTTWFWLALTTMMYFYVGFNKKKE